MCNVINIDSPKVTIKSFFLFRFSIIDVLYVAYVSKYVVFLIEIPLPICYEGCDKKWKVQICKFTFYKISVLLAPIVYLYTTYLNIHISMYFRFALQ